MSRAKTLGSYKNRERQSLGLELEDGQGPGQPRDLVRKYFYKVSNGLGEVDQKFDKEFVEVQDALEQAFAGAP